MILKNEEEADVFGCAQSTRWWRCWVGIGRLGDLASRGAMEEGRDRMSRAMRARAYGWVL